MSLKSECELLRSLQFAVSDLAELLTGKQDTTPATRMPGRRHRIKQEADPIKAEALRKKWVPWSRIAKRYGVTAACIHMLAARP